MAKKKSTDSPNGVTWREYLDARLATFEGTFTSEINWLRRVIYVGFALLLGRIYGPDIEHFFENGSKVVKTAAVCVVRACGLS